MKEISVQAKVLEKWFKYWGAAKEMFGSDFCMDEKSQEIFDALVALGED